MSRNISFFSMRTRFQLVRISACPMLTSWTLFRSGWCSWSAGCAARFTPRWLFALAILSTFWGRERYCDAWALSYVPLSLAGPFWILNCPFWLFWVNPSTWPYQPSVTGFAVLPSQPPCGYQQSCPDKCVYFVKWVQSYPSILSFNFPSQYR